MDRRGAATPVDPGWSFNRGGGNYGWALSPDQTKVALRINTDGNNDIWIKHLPDGPLERLTFEEASDIRPFWTPDGQTVTYFSGVVNDRTVWSKRADGTGEAVLVLDATIGQNALMQVEIFRKIADVSGLVMTKLDGTAKGGILVALADRFALPIHAIGIGEKIDDLAPFHPEDFARALTGAEVRR